jgi:hypothetical protein
MDEKIEQTTIEPDGGWLWRGYLEDAKLEGEDSGPGKLDVGRVQMHARPSQDALLLTRVRKVARLRLSISPAEPSTSNLLYFEC